MDKLLKLLAQHHLLWLQRATMNPELHMALAAGPDCMEPEHYKLLEEEAKAIMEALGKR